MQRLFSLKQASSTFINSSSSSSLLQSLPYKTFSSVTKPTPQNHFLSSPFSHPFHYHSLPWRSKPSLASEIQGFLSYPAVAKRFWFNFSNTHFKVSGKTLLDSRAWFLRPQIPKGRFDVGPNFGRLRSHW